MPDLTAEERLAMQRILREWLAYQLRLTDKMIRDLEHEVEQTRRRREAARIEMSWKLQPGRADRMEPMLHRGSCGLFKTEIGYMDREHVMIALEEFPRLEMCEICNPWGSLGIPQPSSRRTAG